MVIFAKGPMLFVCIGWDEVAVIHVSRTTERILQPRLKYLGPSPAPGVVLAASLPLRESPW